MSKHHLREVGESASIGKDSCLCVKIARRGNAKGILALLLFIEGLTQNAIEGTEITVQIVLFYDWSI